MAENNNNKQVVKKESNVPAEQQMDTMYYRPNEANLNYNGITLNINIPMLIDSVKKFKQKREEKKALKELKKLENKTLEDVKHYDDVLYEEVIEDECLDDGK